MIEAMVRLMNSPDPLTGPINIGNPTEFTILELAKKIIKISGAKSKITYEKLPIDDPKQRKPDITLAKKELDWVPKVEIEEGLIKTIEYFDNLLRNDPRI